MKVFAAQSMTFAGASNASAGFSCAKNAVIVAAMAKIAIALFVSILRLIHVGLIILGVDVRNAKLQPV